tara:strand:+ start:534 stop:2402 length:1869 start_codon:yes stop_codon:yes gene_type:complete
MAYSAPAAGVTRAYSVRGRLDNVQDTIKSSVEMPTFVDNAVLHAEYTRTKDAVSGRMHTLKPPAQSDFQMTHDRRYRFVEEQSAIKLAHADKPGIDREGQVYFDGSKLTTGSQTPLLIYAESDYKQRLKSESIESATQGSRFILQNMRGRTLSDVEFGDESHVRLGQKVGVGFRTTDLVQQLFVDKLHGLNSVSVGHTFAGPRAGTVSSYKGADLARHSSTFLSQNFRGVRIPTALRYIARHDDYALFHDRFGNFLYTPRVFAHTDRTVGQVQGMGKSESDPIADVANRLIVSGKPQANNDDNVIVVDDAELQKQHGHIKQEEVVDPTATTEQSARRSANQFLRANRKAQGAFRSSGHMKSWDLNAGEVVEYQNPVDKQVERVAIIEAKHDLSGNKSEFQFASYQQGLEGVLTAFGGGQEVEADESQPDRSLQVTKKEISGIGRAKINIRMIAYIRHVLSKSQRIYSGDFHKGWDPAQIIPLPQTGIDKHAGFLIGDRKIAKHSAGTHYTTDASNSIRGAMGGGNGSPITNGTNLAGATLTVTSTAGFPTTAGIHISIIKGTTGESAHYTATVASATTFTLVAQQTGVVAGAWMNASVVRLVRSRSHEAGSPKGLAKTFRRY